MHHYFSAQCLLTLAFVVATRGPALALKHNNHELRPAQKEDFKELAWWQTGPIYQVYPRSFKDSNGDGVGDLKGIEMMADYFKELGVGAVWLNPIFKSPMEDFGYDISDYRKVDEIFGNVDDLKSLSRKLKSMGIKLILDFVPNHSSDKHEWFEKSVQKIDPYTNYYVWRNASGKDNVTGEPLPPNNWISVFNIKPAWTYRKERDQFYLHEFLDKQPDLNYRCPELRKDMEDIITFWLDAGIDGFRIDAVPYLVEHEGFPNERYINDSEPHNDYFNIVHDVTMDQPETFEVIRTWRILFDNYSKTKGTDSKVMLTEAYTSFENTMKYYGNDTYPISEMPFNFQLITGISPQTMGVDVARIVAQWLSKMPAGKWANWVTGNHDNFRVATRYGVELTDALNMLVTLLPGTAITYYGEELGMEDVFVRWDQTVDPQGIVLGKDNYRKASRDANRSPMQWNSQLSAGFSTNDTTWLPVNPNFWRLNVEEQRKAEKSHLKNYIQLVETRKTKTAQFGDFKMFTQGNWCLVFTRTLKDNPSFIVVINMATEEFKPDLSKIGIPDLPEKLYVHVASVNSVYKRGDIVSTGKDAFYLRPKAALVLTTSSANLLSSVSLLVLIVSAIVNFVL